MDSSVARQFAEYLAAGDKAQAMRLLAAVLRQNPQDEQVWPAMAQITEGAQRVDCLKRVLAISPNHPQALQMLPAAPAAPAPVPAIPADPPPWPFASAPPPAAPPQAPGLSPARRRRPPLCRRPHAVTPPGLPGGRVPAISVADDSDG